MTVNNLFEADHFNGELGHNVQTNERVQLTYCELEVVTMSSRLGGSDEQISTSFPMFLRNDICLGSWHTQGIRYAPISSRKESSSSEVLRHHIAAYRPPHVSSRSNLLYQNITKLSSPTTSLPCPIHLNEIELQRKPDVNAGLIICYVKATRSFVKCTNIVSGSPSLR